MVSIYSTQYLHSVQYSIYSTLGTVTWSRDPAEDAMCDPTLLITTSTSALHALVLCSLCLSVRVRVKSCAVAGVKCMKDQCSKCRYTGPVQVCLVCPGSVGTNS